MFVRLLAHANTYAESWKRLFQMKALEILLESDIISIRLNHFTNWGWYFGWLKTTIIEIRNDVLIS